MLVQTASVWAGDWHGYLHSIRMVHKPPRFVAFLLVYGVDIFVASTSHMLVDYSPVLEIEDLVPKTGVHSHL